MTTATWAGGIDLQWFMAPNWSGRAVPLAVEDVLISGAAVTIDGTAPAAAADITLGGGATLDLVTALALGGTLSGGALDLAGTLAGGTLENIILAGQGGTLLGVTVAGTLTSVPIGLIAMDATTAGSYGGTVNVYGTLTLEPGLYDALTFAGGGLESLAGTGGPVTLGPGGVVQGLVGLSGDLVNQGQVGAGAAQAVLHIGGAGFANAGTLSLADRVINGSTGVGGTLYHWQQVSAPSVAIDAATLLNSGLITLPGATLTIGGATFDNSGSVVLATATTQLFESPGTVSDLPLTGTLDIAASVASFANTGTITAGTIDFAGPVSLSALGAISGALQFDGTLDLGGGTLDASAYGSVHDRRAGGERRAGGRHRHADAARRDAGRGEHRGGRQRHGAGADRAGRAAGGGEPGHARRGDDRAEPRPPAPASRATRSWPAGPGSPTRWRCKAGR